MKKSETIVPYYIIKEHFSVKEDVVYIDRRWRYFPVIDSYCVDPFCHCHAVILFVLKFKLWFSIKMFLSLIWHKHIKKSKEYRFKIGEPQSKELSHFKLDLIDRSIHLSDEAKGLSRIFIRLKAGKLLRVLEEKHYQIFTARAKEAKVWGAGQINYYLEFYKEKINIQYQEIYPGEPVFEFDYQGEHWRVLDMYCLQADCLCKEAYLCFEKVDTQNQKETACFDVALFLDRYRHDVASDVIPPAEAEAVFGFFKDSKRDLYPLFAKRYKKVKELGRKIAAILRDRKLNSGLPG